MHTQSSAAKCQRQHRHESLLADRNRPQTIHQSLEDSLFRIMIAVADSHPASSQLPSTRPPTVRSCEPIGRTDNPGFPKHPPLPSNRNQSRPGRKSSAPTAATRRTRSPDVAQSERRWAGSRCEVRLRCIPGSRPEPSESVGSRTGAVFRRSGLSVSSPFPLGVPH